MTLTTPHPELSRPYFEQEARFGRRVIFRWTPATRDPGGCSLHRNVQAPRWCVNCSSDPIFEGVKFLSESAAQSFDLEQIDPEDDGAWEQFDDWESASAWLRGES